MRMNVGVLEFRPQTESGRGFDSARATERAIELAISSGLFLAPRRILLDMAAQLKKRAEQENRQCESREMERPIAA